MCSSVPRAGFIPPTALRIYVDVGLKKGLGRFGGDLLHQDRPVHALLGTILESPQYAEFLKCQQLQLQLQESVTIISACSTWGLLIKLCGAYNHTGMIILKYVNRNCNVLLPINC